MAASIPKELIEKWKSETATKTERDFEMDLWTEDSANRIYLKELIAHMEERREHVDKAFLYPEELDEICTNIPELYVVSGTLNSEPSILNRPLGNQ